MLKKVLFVAGGVTIGVVGAPMIKQAIARLRPAATALSGQSAIAEGNMTNRAAAILSRRIDDEVARNILVLGGTEPLGTCILKQLIEARDTETYPAKIGAISALTQMPNGLVELENKIRIIQGDLHNADILDNALENQAVVIFNLHHNAAGSEGMQHMNKWIAERKETALKRLVLISSLDVNQEENTTPEVVDKRTNENLLRNGPFSMQDNSDYVIVRPGRLGSDEVKNVYKASESFIASDNTVSRGDVSHFIVNKVILGHVGDEFSKKTYHVV